MIYFLETESATHMAYLAETIPESRKAEYTILPQEWEGILPVDCCIEKSRPI